MNNELLARLQETVTAGYERSAFFRELYGSPPVIQRSEQFVALPLMARQQMEAADGITDFVVFDDDQLIMELNGLPSNPDSVPFTPLENEYDMDRRFRRTSRMLRFCGADRQNLAVIADNATIYYAAEMERILPWPLVIALADNDDSRRLAMTLADFRIEAIISTLPDVRSLIPSTCRAQITLNQICESNSVGPTSCKEFDVLSLNLVPWLAVSRGRGVYDTLDGECDEAAGDKSQFYIERSSNDTLLVTVMSSLSEAGALSVIRYDTGILVHDLNGNTFTIQRLAGRP